MWGQGFSEVLLHPQATPLRMNGARWGYKPVVQVVVGEAHGAVLTNDGDVFTFGNGRQGQLGHGCVEDAPDPLKVLALRHVTQLSSGDMHMIARTARRP